jgi:hypothetical protein
MDVRFSRLRLFFFFDRAKAWVYNPALVEGGIVMNPAKSDHPKSDHPNLTTLEPPKPHHDTDKMYHEGATG